MYCLRYAFVFVGCVEERSRAFLVSVLPVSLTISLFIYDYLSNYLEFLFYALLLVLKSSTPICFSTSIFETTA
ncbi:hypothetical protein V1520DRAFT_334953 [Lipomyces starkeyi]